MSRDWGSSVTNSAQAASGFAFDVVGVGALNLDYIALDDIAGNPTRSPAPARSFTDRLSELLRPASGEDGQVLEWGVEHEVDSRTIHAVIDAVSSSRPDTTLGGSAFNAIHAIAKTKAGLRLGYVGIAGRVPVIGLSAVQQLDGLGIDSSHVRQDARHRGRMCCS